MYTFGLEKGAKQSLDRGNRENREVKPRGKMGRFSGKEKGLGGGC